MESLKFVTRTEIHRYVTGKRNLKIRYRNRGARDCSEICER